MQGENESRNGEVKPSGDALATAALHVGIPLEAVDRFVGTLQMCGWQIAPVADYNTVVALGRLLSALQELAPPALATAIVVKAGNAKAPASEKGPSEEATRLARQWLEGRVTPPYDIASRGYGAAWLKEQGNTLAREIVRLSERGGYL